MVVFDSVVLDSLNKCMNDIESRRYNYRGWAVCQDILTVNRRWRYVFVSHHPSLVEVMRCGPDTESPFHDGESIACFRIGYLPREMVAEMVSRIIEECPR